MMDLVISITPARSLVKAAFRVIPVLSITIFTSSPPRRQFSQQNISLSSRQNDTSHLEQSFQLTSSLDLSTNYPPSAPFVL
jgi:hypothetical protein